MNFINLQTFPDDWGNYCDFDKSDYKQYYRWALEEGLSIGNIYLNTDSISDETKSKIQESYNNFEITLNNFSKYDLEELINNFNTELLVKELEVLEIGYRENRNVFIGAYYDIVGETSLDLELRKEYSYIKNKFEQMEYTMSKLIALIVDFPKYISFCEEYVANSFYSFSTEEEIDSAIKELNTKLETLDKSNPEYFYIKGEREALYEYKIAFTKSHCGFY